MKKHLGTLAVVVFILAGVALVNNFDPKRVRDRENAEKELEAAREGQAERARNDASTKAMLDERLVTNLAFLEENAKEPNVVSLPSGLQYKVMKRAEGPKPTLSDRVVAHYRGKLINGAIFDDSFRKPRPPTFGLGEVIPGWTEALQLMPVGSTWELFIPPSLGYGVKGKRPSVPGNSTLIFEVYLMEIVN